jgi:uncharacterized protein (DUF1778 family)
MRSRPVLVAARVTAAEKALIIASAEAEGLPVSEFILRTVMAHVAQQGEGSHSLPKKCSQS